MEVKSGMLYWYQSIHIQMLGPVRLITICKYVIGLGMLDDAYIYENQKKMVLDIRERYIIC